MSFSTCRSRSVNRSAGGLYRLTKLLLVVLPGILVISDFVSADETISVSVHQGVESSEKEKKLRRIIFDNDGNEPHFVKELAAHDVLAQRTAALSGTQVDTLFYCTTDSFGITKRPSKVWQLFDSKAGTYERNKTVELAAASVDVLKVMVDFGHRNGMEVFANIRMNDIHDGSLAPDGATRFKDNKYKAAHPEFLVGKKGQRSKTGSWAAINYSVPEVREHMFRYLEESCQEYDIDGLHLDFLRHQCFFRSTILGNACTEEERACMTELITRVRQMMNEIGGKRGRPLLLSVRVPDSLDYCRAIGIDAKQWLESGLLDLMVVTSYFQLSDWSETAAIGEKYGIPVYASLDEARSKEPAIVEPRSSLLAYRGRAAAALGAGIDGIQLFNFFDPNEPHWNQLGDQTSLLKMDKDYFGSVRGMGVSNGGTLPYAEYLTVETLRPDLPKVIDGASETIAKIRLGPMDPTGPKVTLLLRLSSTVDALVVSMDGQQIEMSKIDNEWLEADLEIETFGLRTPKLHSVKVVRQDRGKPIQWFDVIVQERHDIPKGD